MGREQAKKIGIWLSKQKETFDHIYVSDLNRTKSTFDNLKSQAAYL
jgi:phosphohistidine phosphatase SixA